jgi:neopullulanase
LNTNLPAVREFIYGVAEHWIRQGVDGWRLDVPGEINDDAFWREFRRRVKAVNPEAYIVGEIWHEAQRWLQGDQFDAVMNYQFTRACIGFFIGQNADETLTANVGFQSYPPLDASGFAYTINHLLGIYDSAITHVQMNLLDSHDTARFVSIAKGDQSALRLATLFQMTYPGAPSIYYGSEIGMLGGKDPDCRRTFPWGTPGKWDTKLLQFFKDCIALRKRYAALRYGDFRFVFAEGNTIAYLRSLGDQKFIVVINAGAEATINIIVHPEFGLPEGTRLICLPDQQSAYQVKGGLISGIHAGKRDGFVLMAQPPQN